MKQVIFILLLVGLAYLGSVQVARFLYGRYRSTVRGKSRRYHPHP